MHSGERVLAPAVCPTGIMCRTHKVAKSYTTTRLSGRCHVVFPYLILSLGGTLKGRIVRTLHLTRLRCWYRQTIGASIY